MSVPRPLLPPGTEALGPFVDAGVLDAAALHVAATVARAVGGLPDEVLVATALAARAPMHGHVCLVPAEVADTVTVEHAVPEAPGALPWPDTATLAALLTTSPAVTTVDATTPSTPPDDTLLPLLWDGTRLYLERYWRYERSVGDDLLARAGAPTGVVASGPALDAALDDLFGSPGAAGDGTAAPDRQRAAAERALTRRLAVIAGGPGTGKTRTVARLLMAARRVAAAEGRALEVALAAPTGKAAARMTEAVHRAVDEAGPAYDDAAPVPGTEATTLHRLLGGRPGAGFRHNADDPLPHDLIVVDEASMVSLPLMAHLLAALRPETTLVLVGDPFQLTSVEAGAVLGEVVGPAAYARTPVTPEPARPEPARPRPASPAGPLGDHVVLLDRVHRFGPDSAIAALADAIRVGDLPAALAVLSSGGDEVDRVDPADTAALARLRHEVVEHAATVVDAARRGAADEGLALGTRLQVLAATRFGELGAYRWRDRIEEELARARPDADLSRRWYVGRPVIVTRNDYPNRLVNGNVGLVVAGPDRPRVAFPAAPEPRLLAPSQLAAVETLWSMTIHKSQGSEYDRVVVSLAPAPSPVLTRELLYTAVTRARRRVTVVADEATLAYAIGRPVARASGLGARLWPAP